MNMQFLDCPEAVDWHRGASTQRGAFGQRAEMQAYEPLLLRDGENSPDSTRQRGANLFRGQY